MGVQMAAGRQYLASIFSLLLITGRSAFAASSADEELMICRPVTEVFRTIGAGKVDRGILPFFRGPTGPTGPAGKTGSHGVKGQPSDQMILRSLHGQMRDMYAMLFKLEMELYRLAGQAPAQDKKADECMKKFKAPINVGSMCYSLIGGKGLSWAYKDAESNCTALGGYPADLNSREIYEKIYDYVDVSYSSGMDAWTGMSFKSDKLLLANGTEASYAKWIYPYPRKTSTSYGSYYRTYVGISMTLDPSSRVRGIENTRLTRTYPYAICHFSLDGPTPTKSSVTVTTTTSADYSDYYDYYSA